MARMTDSSSDSCPTSRTTCKPCHGAALSLWTLAISALIAASSVVAADDSSQPQPTQYIVGGSTVPRNRYPYLASLGPERWTTEHSCAATLIAPDVLLSAAHCAGSFRYATLGIHDRYDSSEEPRHQTVQTGSTRVHPRYQWSAANPDIDYDFMLIQLTEPVDTRKFPPVQLNRDPSVPSDDAQPLTIAGWGATDDLGNRLSATLRHATVGYVTPRSCDRAQGYISGTFYSYRGFLTDSMMCAWSEVADACLGDSGGPLLVQTSREDVSRDVQVGIVSFGVGCNSPDFPGLYSRVSDQMGWIDEMVCELSGDPPDDFGCVRPTVKPTGRPTSRPTLRPSAAPIRDETKQSVLDMLLGDQTDEGDDGDDQEPQPASDLTELPPSDDTLVWMDAGPSSAKGMSSQMQPPSDTTSGGIRDDNTLFIVVVSVGGAAFLGLLGIATLLIIKRINSRDSRSDDAALGGVRVMSSGKDHRGKPRGGGAGDQEVVEVVAKA